MNEILENEVIYADKLAVFTCNDETDFREIRFYFIQNWKILTRQMDGSTFLFLAGIHGSDSGKLGEKVDIQSLKNQFSHRVLKSYNYEWILEDKEKRNIKFEFLDIPDFFKDEETKEIDKNALVLAIRSIDPQVTIMVICHSQILQLKFLLEETGLFAEMRLNRELNILSNGQILTMNYIQKEFIQTFAHEDNIEKDVVITGPVGSGKTLMALEAINMKKSFYKRKYGLNPLDCQTKLRVIIWIGTGSEDNMLKQDMTIKNVKDCKLEIHTKYDPNPEKLQEILQADEQYKSYSHTLIMFDEIWRKEICRVDLEDDLKMDYVYSLDYSDAYSVPKVHVTDETVKVTETTVECHLDQRQRSSQEILDLADYLWMHSNAFPQRKYPLKNSFSSDVPLWVELENSDLFFDYFRDKMSKDVMLIWDDKNPPSNLDELKKFCRRRKRVSSVGSKSVRGSEALVTILYDIDKLDYEHWTRAKHQLIIVTILGHDRYFFQLFSLLFDII